jgi:acyl-CoA synthetase (NDP forming)
MRNLDAFFSPRTVAVVGASRDPAKIGHLVLKYLLESDARIYPVNPSADEILGHPCYPDLASIPGEVDLAVLAVPAATTVQMVRQCVDKGVGAIIAQASGFGETGEEGRRLEGEIRAILAAAPPGRRPRLLGPNTLGVYVPRRRLDTTFTLRERSPRPGPGDIAFISQSGAAAVCIMEGAATLGVGLSAFVGIGNKLDVDENELLDYFAQDPCTRAIALYLEGFRDGREFLERCRRITPHKPVVVLKTGRSATGARAAALHTGSLAGSDRVVEGALRQVGAFRAYDEEELVDLARALGHGRPLAGKRVAVLTTAGGLGVIATDLLESRDRGVGLELAPISLDGKARLRSVLVPFASVHNPIDLTANGSNEHYAASLEVLEAEPEVDAILCIMQFQSPFVDEGLAQLIIDWFQRGPKPMVVVTIGGELSQQGLRRVVQAGVPAYPSLWRAVRALAALYQRGQYLRRLDPSPPPADATAEPAEGRAAQ